MYLSFLAISVVPAVFLVRIDATDSWDDFPGAIFFYVHSMFVNYVVTFGAIASLCYQWEKATALSAVGLAVQVVVFVVVALSWITRVRFLEYMDKFSDHPFRWTTWYELVGWAVVDNGVFALIQGVLLYLSWKRRHNGIEADEEPLLGN